MRWMILGIVIFTALFLLFSTGKMYANSSELKPQVLDREAYTLFYVKIPVSSGYQIIPVVSSELQTLPELIEKVKDVAVAAINGGFFDPSNQETTSYVIAQGFVLVNPVENRNFIENPELYPYLEKMLNRSEFRMLECNGKQRFDIARHRDPVGFLCKRIHSIQAGPNLFDENGAEKEAFVAYKGDQRVRDPLGIDKRNARSAIGIDKDGNVIMAMVAMKPLADQPTGVTLKEMADIMRELGAKKALSLDGGSSSSFWTEGKTCYGKLDKSGEPVKRPIKSALVVIREENK